jgi:hypothetical protein
MGAALSILHPDVRRIGHRTSTAGVLEETLPSKERASKKRWGGKRRVSGEKSDNATIDGHAAGRNLGGKGDMHAGT